jgi:hypothetical protein
MPDPMTTMKAKDEAARSAEQDAIVTKALKKRRRPKPSKVAADCAAQLLKRSVGPPTLNKLLTPTLQNATYGVDALAGLPTAQSAPVRTDVSNGWNDRPLSEREKNAYLGVGGALGGGLLGGLGGSLIGGGVGGIKGLIAPGKTQEGEERSRVLQMLRQGIIGAGVGGVAGGGLGAAAGHGLGGRLSSIGKELGENPEIQQLVNADNYGPAATRRFGEILGETSDRTMPGQALKQGIIGALLGGGAGAGIGALSSEEGERGKGALKGGLIGGGVGGGLGAAHGVGSGAADTGLRDFVRANRLRVERG